MLVIRSDDPSGQMRCNEPEECDGTSCCHASSCQCDGKEQQESPFPLNRSPDADGELVTERQHVQCFCFENGKWNKYDDPWQERQHIIPARLPDAAVEPDGRLGEILRVHHELKDDDQPAECCVYTDTDKDEPDGRDTFFQANA